eukprot:1159721-Pelagomonas_calceolata.AAC.8
MYTADFGGMQAPGNIKKTAPQKQRWLPRHLTYTAEFQGTIDTLPALSKHAGTPETLQASQKKEILRQPERPRAYMTASLLSWLLTHAGTSRCAHKGALCFGHSPRRWRCDTPGVQKRQIQKNTLMASCTSLLPMVDRAVRDAPARPCSQAAVDMELILFCSVFQLCPYQRPAQEMPSNTPCIVPCYPSNVP